MRGQATLEANIEQLKNTFKSPEIVFSINNEPKFRTPK